MNQSVTRHLTVRGFVIDIKLIAHNIQLKYTF